MCITIVVGLKLRKMVCFARRTTVGWRTTVIGYRWRTTVVGFKWRTLVGGEVQVENKSG